MNYNTAMRIPAQTLIPALFVSLLAGCSSIPVSQDYAPTTDFSALKTYHWDPELIKRENSTKDNNPLLNTRIHNAVDRKLATMGYRLSKDNNADFTVSYQTETRQRLTSDGPSSNISVGFGSFGNFGAIGLGTGSHVRDEDEATLIIDILSSNDHKLLWRGSSTRYVYARKDPAELTKTINEHVDAILNQFPPQKKTTLK